MAVAVRQSGNKPQPNAPIAKDAPQTDTPPLNPYRWLILIGLVLATLMEVLDTTVVNVALPQMMGNFGATTDEIGWVSTGYILSNVVVLPITAWLSHRFGRRNYLAVSIIIFIIASFFCGMSHSLVELVFWRICQGAGGAALLSTAQATIMEIFPRDQMGTVTAFFGVGMIMGDQPILDLGNTPHRPYRIEQPLHFVPQNRAAQRDAPVVRADLDRMRMRHETTHSRTHALDQLQIVGHRSVREQAFRARPHALDPVRRIACGDAECVARIGDERARLVADERAPPFALVRIEHVHGGRPDRGAAEQRCPFVPRFPFGIHHVSSQSSPQLSGA